MSEYQYDLDRIFPEPVILPSVPKETHTPLRSIRVPDDLWDAAREAAAGNGESVSDVVRRALERYVKAGDRRKTGGSR